jgi:hypothetical protein
MSIRFVHVCDDFILFLFLLYLSLSSGRLEGERLKRKRGEKEGRERCPRYTSVAAAAVSHPMDNTPPGCALSRHPLNDKAGAALSSLVIYWMTTVGVHRWRPRIFCHPIDDKFT